MLQMLQISSVQIHCLKVCTLDPAEIMSVQSTNWVCGRLTTPRTGSVPRLLASGGNSLWKILTPYELPARSIDPLLSWALPSMPQLVLSRMRMSQDNEKAPTEAAPSGAVEPARPCVVPLVSTPLCLDFCLLHSQEIPKCYTVKNLLNVSIETWQSSNPDLSLHGRGSREQEQRSDIPRVTQSVSHRAGSRMQGPRQLQCWRNNIKKLVF